jgi:hypothetical protein
VTVARRGGRWRGECAERGERLGSVEPDAAASACTVEPSSAELVGVRVHVGTGHAQVGGECRGVHELAVCGRLEMGGDHVRELVELVSVEPH